MKNLNFREFSVFIFSALFVISACQKEDDRIPAAELLIGTWTTTEVNIVAKVDAQPVTEYLINIIGLSSVEANAVFDNIVSSLTPELTGSLTLKEDHTYQSGFAGNMDSGTWSLSADEKLLTLIEGSDTILISNNSITNNRWDATITEDFSMDLDNNAGTPDELVTVSANLILTK